jgi:hypothetical protein
MSNPISLAYSIASKVTWLPCPSKIKNCLLMNDTPSGIDLLNKDKNFLNNKAIIQVFLYGHTCT